MLRLLWARWAYGSGTDTCTERAHQELMRILTKGISSLRTCSAYASVLPYLKGSFCISSACALGTDACTEHAYQELMHALSIHMMCALSIRVRTWCMHWAYVSGTNGCTDHSPFKTCWTYASGTGAYPERTRKHTCQELMRTLSIRISFLHVCSA
jgi:hypothetical protein